MKKKPYKRKCGDFEVRVLADGRVVMIAPDQKLLDLARQLDPNTQDVPQTTENKQDGRSKRT